MAIYTEFYPDQMKDVENKGKVLFPSVSMASSAVIFTKLITVEWHRVLISYAEFHLDW